MEPQSLNYFNNDLFKFDTLKFLKKTFGVTATDNSAFFDMPCLVLRQTTKCLRFQNLIFCFYTPFEKLLKVDELK